MIWNDIAADAATPRRYLRTDWSKCEAAFKSSLRSFQEGISKGNPEVAPVVLQAKNWPSKENEKKSSCRQELIGGPVESEAEGKRLGTQCDENPATRPAQPKEQDVPNSPLDELLFGDPPSNPNPIGDPVKSEKAEMIDMKEVEIDPFDVTNAALPSSPLSEEVTDEVVMEGFDHARFAKAQKVADNLLADTSEINLGAIVARLGEYEVNLSERDFDAHRENPNVLADCIIEIQAKKDSVHADLLRITPVAESLKEALSFVIDFGLQCSSESNREKRLAQAKYKVKELFTRYVLTERLRHQLDMKYRHLSGQHESVSRIITWHSQFPRTLDREAMVVTAPSGPPSRSPSRPEPSIPPPEPPSKKMGDDLFDNLDSMPSTPKVEKPDKFSKGEIDW